jgi:prepilin signal peptidase PulO-like enzyme (type II secretory pathway)
VSATHIDHHPLRFALSPLELAVATGFVVSAVTPLGYLGGVGILVLAAAAFDARSGRIPNGLVLSIAMLTAVRSMTLIVTGDAPIGSIAADVVAGVVLSGSVTLFVVWLVRPTAVGGGDWKLLAVVGAAFGVVDPLAAAVVGAVAAVVQLVAAGLARRRQLVFAPAMLAGFLAAATATLWLHHGAGGWS